MSLLLDVNSSMPSSPCSQGRKHATLSAHVTESTLTTSVSTTSRNTRDTSNGSTGTPRGSTMLHTSFHENTMGLSSVSGEILMNEANDIWSDGGFENSRKSNMLV